MSQRSVVKEARKQLAHYNKEKEIDESRGPSECADFFIDAYTKQLNMSIMSNARYGSSVSELSIDLSHVGGACSQKCNDDPVFRNATAMSVRDKLQDRYGARVKYEGYVNDSIESIFMEHRMEFNINISSEPKK